jgi:heat shock protein HslJ
LQTGNRIEIVDLVSTLIFCEEPAGVMDQESALLDMMNDAASFEVANNRLRIITNANDELVFEEKP